MCPIYLLYLTIESYYNTRVYITTSHGMSVFPIVPRKGRRGHAHRNNFALDDWDPYDSPSIGNIIPLTSGIGQMDWKETADSHVFIADLPGVRKDEVKVEVEEEKILKISGQQTIENEEKNDKWHRVERYLDKFQRSIKLPHNASAAGAKAELVNGVLTVIVPKEQEKKAPGRFIPISG